MSDVLVVASKVKAYVKDNSEDFRTSGDVMEKLTTIVQRALDDAIRECGDKGMKTVQAKHFP